MPFTRQLEVYVHPLHPPLTPSQLERRALFSHHFGSFLPLPFIPRQGRPSRDPPSFPFWFPPPERLVSASENSSAVFSPPATTAAGTAAGNPAQPRSPTSAQGRSSSSSVQPSNTSSLASSSLGSCSLTSSSLLSSSLRTCSLASSVDYASLRLLPGYSYAAGATYSSPPGQRLRLHYLSPAEGAGKCRTQVRSDGLRFSASGSRLLVAAREHVLLLNVAGVAVDRCITCPGASIVLPHNTNPDLIAVAGQEAYQQSPYVRLYDVRTPPSTGKSSTSRSSSSSSGVGDASPVVEMWGPRHDGWWSACWSPVGDKIVCVDRKDVLHVFSLDEGMWKSSRAAAAAEGSRPPRTDSAATAAVSSKSSTSSGVKRSAAAAEIGDHFGGSVQENSSGGTRPKTPFAGTPGSGVGRVAAGVAAARPPDAAGTSASSSESGGSSTSSTSFKRSSASSPGSSPPPGAASFSTSSPHSSNTPTGSPRTSTTPVYTQQLEGIANACTFHPSGEFLLIAEDNGNLLILPFDATSSRDPLMKAAYAAGQQCESSCPPAAATSLPVAPASLAAESLTFSLRLHQGGVTCCAADPAGRFVATGGSSSERNVLILNADSMEVVGEIGRTEGGLQALAFSFDGQFLAWGCRDAAASSTAASGRGSSGDGGSYGGGRSSGNESSSEDKQETFLTIAGTDPCEIYLQCATPAAVSAVAFHPNRYICAFATEADSTSAGAQQQTRQGMGSTTFWTKPQHPQQQYHLGFFSFE